MRQREFTALALPGRRIRELGAERDQITVDRFEHRAGRLDRDMATASLELAGKRRDFRRQERLTAGDHDVFCWVLLNFAQDICKAPYRAFRLPRSIGRIAPDAAEIAARRPDKYRWHADQPALALDGVK